jgi:hypothetical protein
MTTPRYIEKSIEEIEYEDTKAVEKSIMQKIGKVSNEIGILNDLLEDESEIQKFDPEGPALMFDKPEMTIREYFKSEMVNLNHGLSFLNKSVLRVEAVERCSILSILIDKALDPEKFFKYSFNFILTSVFGLEKMRERRDMKNQLDSFLSSIGKTITDFNVYKTKRKIEISNEEIESMKSVNVRLQNLSLPLIEV